MTPPAADTAAPPGWPRTDRPLRIALLGWARLAFQGTQGSGYNLSASELAAGMAMSGHHVFYLASGRRYNLWPRPYIAPTERWRGVECFDLFNSPNISPASYNFKDAARQGRELSCPAQSRLILRWLDRVGVQVVHIHSLEGFPLDLIPAIRATGRPVIVTPHNYWFICPQVDLMRHEVSLCRDYEGGRACETCLPGRSPFAGRLKRRFGHVFESIIGVEVCGWLRRAAKEVPTRLRELRGVSRPLPNARDPDSESALGFDTGDGDGLIRHNLRPEPGDEHRKPVGPATIDDNERFLAADHHLTVLNDYGRRRIAGVEALNHASLVTPPSDFVRRIYIKMGLDERRSRVVRLGQPHFDQIHRLARRSPFYGSRPWDARTSNRPLRLGFLGAMRPSKGIDVLCAAIPLLPKNIRQRCQFHIRAQGKDWAFRKKLSLYPEVSFQGGYDLLQLIGAIGEYDVGILPHVWFENSPLVLLEHLHAGKFVICSRLGGVTEWLDPPKNGLFIPGGHPDLLADAISRLVRGEIQLPTPREIQDATPILRSYPDHVMEVEAIYRECLGEPRRAPVVEIPAGLRAAAAP